MEDERVLRLEEPLASAAKKSEGRRVTGLKHSMSHLNMILRSHLTGLATRSASLNTSWTWKNLAIETTQGRNEDR